MHDNLQFNETYHLLNRNHHFKRKEWNIPIDILLNSRRVLREPDQRIGSCGKPERVSVDNVLELITNVKAQRVKFSNLELQFIEKSKHQQNS